MSKVYAAGLRLEGAQCLVVGGGTVAERRVRPLLAAGADVHLVAPSATPVLQGLAEDGRLQWSARPAEPSDFDGCILALVCTDDRETNRLLGAEARSKGILVNVADAPEESTLAAPAMVERGDLQVAVWSGAGPVVSQLARDKVAAALGEEWAALCRVVARCRADINRRLPAAQRAAFWRAAIDERLLALLREGDEAAAEAVLRQVIARHESC